MVSQVTQSFDGKQTEYEEITADSEAEAQTAGFELEKPRSKWAEGQGSTRANAASSSAADDNEAEAPGAALLRSIG